MECTTPPIDAPDDVALHGNRTRQLPGNKTVTWEIYIGFSLDGVDEYDFLVNSSDPRLREKGLLTVNVLPQLPPHPYQRNGALWYTEDTDIWFTVRKSFGIFKCIVILLTAARGLTRHDINTAAL